MTICHGYDLSSVSVIQGSYTIEQGHFITGENEYKIALGTGLAKKLNSKIGSLLTLMTTTKDGALNAVDVEVTCIIKTGVKEYDDTVSIIPIRLAKSLLDVDAVENYIVMLDKTESVQIIKALIEENSKRQNLSIEIKTWQDLAQFYQKVKSMNETYYMITQIIILVIVAFSIINDHAHGH